MKIIKTTKDFDILLTDKILDLPLILIFTNKIHNTPTVSNFDHYINDVDIFEWSDWFKNECEMKNMDMCDVLLDWYKYENQRYRNYSNTEGISYLYRHPRNSLRSIVNAAEMYDKPILYWYYMGRKEKIKLLLDKNRKSP